MTNTRYGISFAVAIANEPNTWTENLNEILDHLIISHSLNNSAPPVLFRIIQRNNESFESITFENDPLSITKPSINTWPFEFNNCASDESR